MIYIKNGNLYYIGKASVRESNIKSLVIMKKLDVVKLIEFDKKVAPFRYGAKINNEFKICIQKLTPK
jgi:hypothetical protein